MLPYSSIAAIDYTAAYQSRSGLQTSSIGAHIGSPFTHSWLVPPNDECNADFKHQQHIEPGHVLKLFSNRSLKGSARAFVACELWLTETNKYPDKIHACTKGSKSGEFLRKQFSGGNNKIQDWKSFLFITASALSCIGLSSNYKVIESNGIWILKFQSPFDFLPDRGRRKFTAN